MTAHAIDLRQPSAAECIQRKTSYKGFIYLHGSKMSYTNYSEIQLTTTRFKGDIQAVIAFVTSLFQ